MGQFSLCTNDTRRSGKEAASNIRERRRTLRYKVSVEGYIKTISQRLASIAMALDVGGRSLVIPQLHLETILLLK